MKKLLLTFALASAVVVVNAQDMTSKRGVPILPEAGEWAIGFDATPFFSYFSSLFAKETITIVDPVTGLPIVISTGTSSPSFDFTRENTLWFKKVRDEAFHYRGMLRIGFSGETTTRQSEMFSATPPTVVTYVDDERKVSEMNIALGAGFEMRRGKGRLQGYYGPELIVNFGSSSEEFTYGNAFSQANQNPTSTTDFDNNIQGSVSSRTTEINNGSTFGLTLRGFVGLEYFFAPKLSVGGEFGWGLGFQSRGDAEETSESFNSTNNAAQTTVTPKGSSSSFGIDTDNVGGAIRLVGYF